MLRPGPWLACLLACSSCGTRRPAPISDYAPLGDAGDAGGFMLPTPRPPPLDASGICGRVFVPLVVERPNFYFVVDASGSMQGNMYDPNVTGFIPSRYRAAREAIQNVLEAVGHRINYGAGLFPAEADSGAACVPGADLLPVQPGDPVSFALSGQQGPVLQKLLTRLRNRAPGGGTPTAATLRSLEGEILGLSGKTFLFLLTDGAPNCNPSTACAADNCTINVEGSCSTDPRVNCCDPRSGSGGDYRDCVDSDATIAAITDYAKAGIPTYVIGLSGVKYYQDVLNRMADAGGTALAAEHRYYSVDSEDALITALRGIGLALTISCEVTLAAANPPPDPTRVNVYFDGRLVKQNPDGWMWDTADGGPPAFGSVDSDADAGLDAGAPARIKIVGKSCDDLKNGNVVELQVVAGCPTVVK
jgi:hypothetical protein